MTDDLLEAIEFYKNIGFLRTFPFPHYLLYHLHTVPSSRLQATYIQEVYRRSSFDKAAAYTFCYLKYGTKYSHVMIGDLDEVPAFDTSKFADIMQITRDLSNKRRKQGKPTETLYMKSYQLLKCVNMTNEFTKNFQYTMSNNSGKLAVENILGKSSRILSRNFKVSPNKYGKSIHESGYWLSLWHHWGWTSLADVNYFTPFGNGKKYEKSSFHLQMRVRHRDTRALYKVSRQDLYTAHARGR